MTSRSGGSGRASRPASRWTTTTAGSAFGLVALFMSAMGLYGVQSYLVSERAREIGIRMALGAKAREVVGSVFRRGVLLGGLGIVIGLGLTLGLGRFVGDLLFQVDPRDPRILLVVAGVLLATSLFASYGPARHASRLDPMRVLREE